MVEEDRSTLQWSSTNKVPTKKRISWFSLNVLRHIKAECPQSIVIFFTHYYVSLHWDNTTSHWNCRHNYFYLKMACFWQPLKLLWSRCVRISPPGKADLVASLATLRINTINNNTIQHFTMTPYQPKQPTNKEIQNEIQSLNQRLNYIWWYI